MPLPVPLRIVQVGSLGSIGDNVYRQHQPAAALACQPGVEVLRLIHQRRLLGKVSVCEVNDSLPDVQAWNAAHHCWSDPRGLHLFRELIRHRGSQALKRLQPEVWWWAGAALRAICRTRPVWRRCCASGCRPPPLRGWRSRPIRRRSRCRSCCTRLAIQLNPPAAAP